MDTGFEGDTLLLVGVVGSLRRDSYNRKLLRAARYLVPRGVSLDIWDGLGSVPPFNEDDEQAPAPAVVAMRHVFDQANAMIIATPQYNASLPGQLKNALDWASRPYAENVLRGKPVAVIGASQGPSGAARAHAEARAVLGAIGAEVVTANLSLGRVSMAFDDTGRLINTEHRAHLEEVLRQAVRTA